MKQLGHPITTKKCHFCKTRINIKTTPPTYLIGETRVAMGLLTFRCVCGKAQGFADEKDLEGKLILQLLEAEELSEENG